MTNVQKGVLVSMLAFIPFYFIILLPLLTRNHLTSKMNIPASVMFSRPKEIFLVQSGIIPPTMKIQISGRTARVPRDFTPVELASQSVLFSKTQRPDSRSLGFGAFKNSKPIEMKETGVISWFVPADLKGFFDYTLSAYWHPARLMCKGYFLISQGINGQIYETSWDADTMAYVFPKAGNSGFIGRIFRKTGPEYTEFAYYDSIDRVQLTEWVDLAKMMTFDYDHDPSASSTQKPVIFSDLLERAAINETTQWQAVETSLNQYFKTGSSSWILPIVAVQEARGFNHSLLEFYRKFYPLSKTDPAIATLWNDVLDRTVRRLVKMEMDPHLNLNYLVVNCVNIGEFPLRKLRIKINLVVKDKEETFQSLLFPDNFLFPGVDKNIEVPPPDGISVHAATNIRWRVLDVEIED